MKGKKYYIENITDYQGNIKTDDRYPNRIGSIVQLNQEPTLNIPMCFRYVKYDENGYTIEDHITLTTTVKKIKNIDDIVAIYTANSIFYFKEMEI